MFGWEVLSLPAGLMWTLPGYGDHLEESTPGLRAQMEQMGAPAGFIDVVAALRPIGPDDSATPAHWNVTFGVDDAEATAARAKELGGEIVSGPLDAPWTRLVVIKDPQGASFVAGQFVPREQRSRGLTGPALALSGRRRRPGRSATRRFARSYQPGSATSSWSPGVDPSKSGLKQLISPSNPSGSW